MEYAGITVLDSYLFVYLMSNNMEGCGKKWLWPNLWYYPGIALEELRKTREPSSGYEI
jgi:hypothetical protein